MELLAPAGGSEQLLEAVHYGADAVYLAGKHWGMRSGCTNFSDEELARAVASAHNHGVRVHVTLNTVMTDEDIDQLPAYLALLDELGVDALIVADLGALSLARRYAPHVAIHVSTQASVMSAEAAEAWARLGASRVILAREMTLSQVAELRSRVTRELELEVFAHGSMCVAYSGRCLLSADLMGPERSASHGSCTQPCRWDWTLVEPREGATLGVETDERGTYLLSSSDLCMIEYLDELAEAGIDAIKLEGRAKGAYYVGCVTNAYRHVLDGEPADVWAGELDLVSHRPYSTGFFFGAPQARTGQEGYERLRRLVGVVSACTPCADGGFELELSCRNRAEEGAVAEVLTPGEPVRHFTLGCALVTNGSTYRVRCPFPVRALDLVCVRDATA